LFSSIFYNKSSVELFYISRVSSIARDSVSVWFGFFLPDTGILLRGLVSWLKDAPCPARITDRGAKITLAKFWASMSLLVRLSAINGS